MGYLSRDAILSVKDIPTEDVEVSEWGGRVRVRGLTGNERDAFEESILEGKGRNRTVSLKQLRAKLAVRCIVDEAGQRLFGDADAGALGELSAAGLDRIFTVAARLSALTEEDVGELAGNLLPTSGEDSSSNSHGS